VAPGTYVENINFLGKAIFVTIEKQIEHQQNLATLKAQVSAAFSADP